MARLPRLYAPGIAQHVLQRPADGRILFVDQDDYGLFAELLADAVGANGPKEVRARLRSNGIPDPDWAGRKHGKREVVHLRGHKDIGIGTDTERIRQD